MGKTRRQKRKSHLNPAHLSTNPSYQTETATGGKLPRSFVIRRGKVSKGVAELVSDTRRLMKPHTAVNLKEKNSNSVKDFLSVAGPLGITHLLAYSQTERSTYLRIGRVPRGPTLSFKVLKYSLTSDLARFLSRPHSTDSVEYHSSPLIVLNNFGSTPAHDPKEAGPKKPSSQAMKLMSIMFQNMFPAINIQTIKIGMCRRVLLLNYNADSDTIDWRHYSINSEAVGITKSIKRVVHAKIPDLSKYDDIADAIIAANGGFSDSEVESGAESGAEENKVEVEGRPKHFRGAAISQRKVKLTELGPRLELQLVKIEEEFLTGHTIYHKYVNKTAAEVAASKKKIAARAAAKAARKAEQEENVKRKAEAKEAAKLENWRKIGKIPQKEGEDEDEDEDEDQDQEVEDFEFDEKVGEDEFDDIEWYRKEVGEEPDEEFKATTKEAARREKEGAAKRSKFNPFSFKKKKTANTKSSKDNKRKRSSDDNEKDGKSSKSSKRQKRK